MSVLPISRRLFNLPPALLYALTALALLSHAAAAQMASRRAPTLAAGRLIAQNLTPPAQRPQAQSHWIALAVAADNASASGKFAQSQALLLQAEALAVTDQSFYRLSHSLYWLAEGCYSNGQFAQAAKYFRQAIGLLNSKPEGPLLADSLDGLARSLAEQNQFDELENVCQRSIKIRHDKPVQRSDLVEPFLTYAELFQHKGDYYRAEQLLRQAVATSKSCGNRELDLCLSYLIELRKKEGKLDESMQICQSAIKSKELSALDQRLISKILDCCEGLAANNRFVEAEHLNRSLIRRIEQIEPPPGYLLIYAYSCLANHCLAPQHRIQEAIKIYKTEIEPLTVTAVQKRLCRQELADLSKLAAQQ